MDRLNQNNADHAPSPSLPPSIPFRQYRRVLPWLRPYWRALSVVLLLSLLSSALGLTQPYVSRMLIDDALLRHSMKALERIALLMVALTLLSAVVSIGCSYLYIRFSARSLFDMRLSVYRHLQRLSPQFFARRKLGDVVSRLNNDIGEVQRVCSDTLLSSLSNALSLAGSVAIMAWLNWRLCLVSLALLPAASLSLRHFQVRLTSRTRRVRECSAGLGSFLIESLMAMRLVVASGNEEREARNFERHNSSFISALLRLQFLSFLAGAAPGLLLTVSTAMVFLYGGRLVIQGHLSLGGLVAFMAYHLRLLTPVQSLFGVYTNLLTGAVSLERVLTLLDIPPEIREDPQAQRFRGARREIRFDGVSFAYPDRGPVLRDISLRIPAGALCALVGSSGAGKSTVAEMLLRFYDPERGSIAIDGLDLRRMKLDDLRREIALVEQSPFFFHASIRENIAYGRPEATEAEIRSCASAACIASFIESLPEQYDTILGERGVTVSVGERQRIALARALLRNPSLLILDEPTSALDAQSEAAVARELARVLRGRTALVITHRAALAELADLVFVMESGRIVDWGTPADLYARRRLAPLSLAPPSLATQEPAEMPA